MPYLSWLSWPSWLSYLLKQKGLLMISKRLCIKYSPHTYQRSDFVPLHVTARPTLLWRGSLEILITRGWIYRGAESKANIRPITSQSGFKRCGASHPTDIGIANIDGGSLYDGRVAGTTSLWFRPLRNAQDFHKHLQVLS